MKKIVNKLLHPTKTKWFWGYIVLGVIALILAVMLMPVWDKTPDWVFWKSWGMQIVNIIICICIVLYLLLFLLKKVRSRSNGVIKVLTIIEFVVLALIALGCILQQFKVINVGGACAILGLALWCRGCVEIFRAYYHQKGNNDRYPVWWLVVSLVLVTLGTYLFAKRLFSDVTVLWIFVILIILVALLLIVDGILAKPKGSKQTKTKSNKENKSQDTK